MFKSFINCSATGIFDKVPSPNSNNHLPTKFRAINPISKIANKGTVNPKVRLIKSCNKGFKVMKGFNCFGTEVTNVKTNLLTNDDNHMVVANGITTNKPAMRSFLRSCWS